METTIESNFVRKLKNFSKRNYSRRAHVTKYIPSKLTWKELKKNFTRILFSSTNFQFPFFPRTFCSQIPRRVARSINKPARNRRRVFDKRRPPRRPRHRLCHRHRRRPVRKHGQARQARWPRRLRTRRERRRCLGWPWSWERTRRYHRCTWRRG